MTSKLFRFLFIAVLTVSAINFSYSQKQDAPPPVKANPEMKACQPGACCPDKYFGISDLTTEQKAKIDDLRLTHLKEVTALKNQLKEKKAKVNTLLDAEKTDVATLNAAIDEFTTVTNQLIKKKAEYINAVRKVLTEKQRILFDAKSDLFDSDGCCPGDKAGKKGPGNGEGCQQGPKHEHGKQDCAH